ncbi:MAG TPA: OmpH family outer membrane protein [Nitrospirales bacterium]
MKRRVNILAILTACILGFVVSAAAVEQKIAVVNPQDILNGTKKGKKIKDMLAEYVQTRQRVVQSEEADLKKLEAELASTGPVLSAAAKQEKQAVFQKQLAAYDRRLQELEGEVQAKKRDALGEFTKAIEQAVQQIAENENILLVLEKGRGGPATGILYNQDSLDLTSRVIKALDSKSDQ